MQRARDDAVRFEEAARAFGYYNSTVAVTIDARPLDDPTLVDAIDHAPASPPIPVAVTIAPGATVPHRADHRHGHRCPRTSSRFLGSPPGRTALAAPVVAAQNQLLTALREASYPFATVDLAPAVLHRDRRTLDVSFQIAPGPKAPLGPIRFTGLHDMSEAWLRKRLLIQPGDPFQPSRIDKARQDLLSLGVFSSVRMIPATKLNAAGALPLDVDVEERKRHAVDVGAAWSTDLGANANIAWHHRNLFGEAEQLNLTAAVQLGGDATTKPGGQVGAQFIKPDFLRRDQSLQIDLSAVDQSLIPYDQRALIEKIGITRKLWTSWSIQGGILAEQEVITQEGVTRPYAFVGLPFSVKYDSTKSLLDPVSGLRAAVSIMPVQSLNGGGTYTVTQVTGSTYFDLSHQGRSVIALRGLIGQVAGVGVFGLPPDQRLYAGGTDTVRGYRYQSIGPKFADGKPIGGTAVSAATVEFRQRFLEHWGAAAFLDVGQASDDGKPFSANWRAGAGAGAALLHADRTHSGGFRRAIDRRARRRFVRGVYRHRSGVLMRRVLKILAWCLAVLLAIPLLLPAAVLLGANTAPGRRLIETLAPRLSGGMVRIEGLSGRFPDALRAGTVTVADADGVWLTVNDAVLDWSPRHLLEGQVAIERLEARRVRTRSSAGVVGRRQQLHDPAAAWSGVPTTRGATGDRPRRRRVSRSRRRCKAPVKSPAATAGKRIWRSPP